MIPAIIWLLRNVERDAVFYPLQILLLPALIMVAGLVWGGSA